MAQQRDDNSLMMVGVIIASLAAISTCSAFSTQQQQFITLHTSYANMASRRIHLHDLTMVNKDDIVVDDDDDGWGDSSSSSVESSSSSALSDKISQNKELARLQEGRLKKSKYSPSTSNNNGSGSGERDLFIPVVTLISVIGFTSLYGYEMLRLYARGELYLPWEQ